MNQTDKKIKMCGDHPFSLYQLMWKKGLDFDSKSNCSEFGWAMLVHVLVFAFFIILSHIEITVGITEFGMISAILFVIYFLTSYVPAISLMRRRLRDVDRSGASLWLLWLPFAGWIALGVLLFSKGIDSNEDPS